MGLLGVLLQIDTGGITSQASEFVGNYWLLAGGIGLVLVTVFFWFALKRILENTALGVATLAVLYFFQPELFAKLWSYAIPTLAATVIFGPAGIGVMLFLAWLGVV